MNKTLWQYYVDTAAQITDQALNDIQTLEQWQSQRDQRHDEFLRSMGVHDIPPCDLKVTSHGQFQGPGYRAQRLAYQLLPNVWGTGNLILPDPMPAEKLPAVLYACGHTASGVGEYSRHTLSWVRRGYAVFVFDTICQTDNPGQHRGLHAGTRLDWISRGYTAAGGELLNGLRAFDVLASQAQVDPDRIGATGRSGGGAQSFFIAIAQPKVRIVLPVVGVASLKLTVADRGYRNQCDCMYAMSLYQRDNIDFAALLAPRPVMFCFAQGDDLFSLDEYRTLAARTRHIYNLYGCPENCQLLEYPGGHTQAEPAATKGIQFFDTHLLGETRPVQPLGEPEIDEPLATVFNGQTPSPNRLDLLPELMTVGHTSPLPRSADDWPDIRAAAIDRLRRNVFHWLDRTSETATFQHRCHNRHQGEIGGMEVWLETPQQPPASDDAPLILAVCDTKQSTYHMAIQMASHFPGQASAILEPRATGNNAPDLSHGTHDVQRVGSMLGLTVPMLWLNDLRHTIEYLRTIPGYAKAPLYLYGHGDAAIACLFHAILNENVAGLFMVDAPESQLDGAHMPGILREAELTTAVGLMAPRPIGIVARNRGGAWYRLRWGHRVYHRLQIPKRHALGWTIPDVRDAVLSPQPQPDSSA